MNNNLINCLICKNIDLGKGVQRFHGILQPEPLLCVQCSLKREKSPFWHATDENSESTIIFNLATNEIWPDGGNSFEKCPKFVLQDVDSNENKIR